MVTARAFSVSGVEKYTALRHACSIVILTNRWPYVVRGGWYDLKGKANTRCDRGRSSVCGGGRLKFGALSNFLLRV